MCHSRNLDACHFQEISIFFPSLYQLDNSNALLIIYNTTIVIRFIKIQIGGAWLCFLASAQKATYLALCCWERGGTVPWNSLTPLNSEHPLLQMTLGKASISGLVCQE